MGGCRASAIGLSADPRHPFLGGPRAAIFSLLCQRRKAKLRTRCTHQSRHVPRYRAAPPPQILFSYVLGMTWPGLVAWALVQDRAPNTAGIAACGQADAALDGARTIRK